MVRGPSLNVTEEEVLRGVVVVVCGLSVNVEEEVLVGVVVSGLSLSLNVVEDSNVVVGGASLSLFVVEDSSVVVGVPSLSLIVVVVIVSGSDVVCVSPWQCTAATINNNDSNTHSISQSTERAD